MAAWVERVKQKTGHEKRINKDDWTGEEDWEGYRIGKRECDPGRKQGTVLGREES